MSNLFSSIPVIVPVIPSSEDRDGIAYNPFAPPERWSPTAGVALDVDDRVVYIGPAPEEGDSITD